VVAVFGDKIQRAKRKKKKLTDIGFSSRIGYGFNKKLTGRLSDIGWIDLDINQLLLQNYTATMPCTRAVLTVFATMDFTQTGWLSWYLYESRRS